MFDPPNQPTKLNKLLQMTTNTLSIEPPGEISSKIYGLYLNKIWKSTVSCSRPHLNKKIPKFVFLNQHSSLIKSSRTPRKYFSQSTTHILSKIHGLKHIKTKKCDIYHFSDNLILKMLIFSLPNQHISLNMSSKMPRKNFG